MTKTNEYNYEDILNRKWILTKWSTDVNAMVNHEVRITAVIDGPNGHDWIVGEGWGLSEFTMPLEHFRTQAVPMGGKEAVRAFMDESAGPIIPIVGPTQPKEAVRAFMEELVA